MTVEHARVCEVLALRRREVPISLTGHYTLIGVYSFGKGIFHREPKSGADLGDYRFFAIEPGDLVLSNIQAWEGAIGYAGQKDAGTVGTHRFLSYVPISDRIDANWARWFFLSEPGMNLIRQAAPGTTIRNRTLAIDRFEALEIPLPSIEEQRRVADQLDRIADGVGRLGRKRDRSSLIASALPTSLRKQLEGQTSLNSIYLGDVLEPVRNPVEIDPITVYVTMGIRSFGRGIFHYPPRPGADIGKLRFQSVTPRLLAVSNIKAWEGAVATTEDGDGTTVASNRFLFFRPVAGEDATDYFWSVLLGHEGLAALGRASPGSADRNRTLAVDRFLRIKLDVPGPRDQARIGRRLRDTRNSLAHYEARVERAWVWMEAVLPAALNRAFAELS